MGLDIRIPLGLVFLIIGGIMGIFGICTNGDAVMYQKSLGMNINLDWGGIMFAFERCGIAAGLIGVVTRRLRIPMRTVRTGLGRLRGPALLPGGLGNLVRLRRSGVGGGRLERVAADLLLLLGSR